MSKETFYYMYAWSPAYQMWFRPLLYSAQDINQTYRFAEEYFARTLYHLIVVEAAVDPFTIPRPPTDYR